ncbi:hypothetical protein ACFE04_005723 [Oxalis oulophora]
MARVIQRLGVGANGCVDLVVDLTGPMDHEIVFVVKSSYYNNSEPLQKEHHILTHLPTSPYIMRCLGERRSYDQYHLLLEYAPSGTLQDIIDTNHNLSENEVKTYTRMILRGLNILHNHSIIHCDLRPSNIFLSYNNKLMIGNLGHASTRSISPQDPNYVFFGLVNPYMSPEFVRYGEVSTSRDIWSLGCTVSQMITGQRPWSHLLNQDYSVFFNQLRNGPETPIIPENLSEKGKDFLSKCFCRDPKQRWTVEMLLGHPFLS